MIDPLDNYEYNQKPVLVSIVQETPEWMMCIWFFIGGFGMAAGIFG